MLEAKKLWQDIAVKSFDAELLRARIQGERYTHALPICEGHPFAVDVERVIELNSSDEIAAPLYPAKSASMA